jgi:hypothetical protein
MNKPEFLKMMCQDNETEANAAKKAQFADVIDCMELALSQSPDSVDIDGDKNLKDAFTLIEKDARKSAGYCCGPFRAAEILAEYLGVKYCRASKKFGGAALAVALEDFL